MKITSRGRYAVTAILDIAIYSYNNSKPVALYDVASRQDISLSYLEQLFIKLKKYKLVTSIKGPGGGYLLAKNADKISIADIISAVDENVDARQCKGENNCKNGSTCITHELWRKISSQLNKFLKDISVASLVSSVPNLDKKINPKKVMDTIGININHV